MVSKQRVQSAERPETSDTTTDDRRPPHLSEVAKRWIEENAEAIRSSNEYVAKHGLPLAKYRLF